MWVAIAATCVTSSMFLTALAPNLLAVELVRKTAHVEIGWLEWFKAFAPVGIVLLALLPLLVYWIYPPQVKEGPEVPAWAAQELAKMGPLSRREILLGVLVVIALDALDFRRRHHGGHHRGDRRHLADAAAKGRHLGRHHSPTRRRGTRSPGSPRWSRSPTA